MTGRGAFHASPKYTRVSHNVQSVLMLSPSLLWCVPLFGFFAYWAHSDVIVTAKFGYMVAASAVFWGVTVRAAGFMAGAFGHPTGEFSKVLADCLRACHHTAVALACVPFLSVPLLGPNEDILITPYAMAVQVYILWGYFWFCVVDCVSLRGAGLTPNLLYAVHHAVSSALIAMSVYLHVEVSGLVMMGTFSASSAFLSLRAVARVSKVPTAFLTGLDVLFVGLWFGLRMPSLISWTWTVYAMGHLSRHLFAVLLGLNSVWSALVLSTVSGKVASWARGRPDQRIVDTFPDQDKGQQEELPQACKNDKNDTS